MLGWQLPPFRVARRDEVSRSAAAQDGAGGREERQISSLRRWVLGKAALLEPPRMHLREGRKEDCAGRELTCRSRSEEHTSELQSRFDLVCRLLLEKKKKY